MKIAKLDSPPEICLREIEAILSKYQAILTTTHNGGLRLEMQSNGKTVPTKICDTETGRDCDVLPRFFDSEKIVLEELNLGADILDALSANGVKNG